MNEVFSSAVFRVMSRLLIVTVALLIGTTRSAPAAAVFVNGSVPDWNQPYQYTGLSLNGGPGPDPVPNVVNQWNDWCAPSSGANLAGHWADFAGLPVADTNTFPASSAMWAAYPSWQDYLADGMARPGPQAAAGWFPPLVTDIGWYMDTNRGVPWDLVAGSFMGGWFFGNANHAGTFLKDIHAGLKYYLDSKCLTAAIFWTTGTQGKNFAAGQDPLGNPAQTLNNAASAFAEVVSEINNNRTLILCFSHWSVIQTASNLPPVGVNTESANGGTFFRWGSTPGPNPTNAEDEAWNYYDNDYGLGHAVTAVGYIPAGDPDDKGPSLGLGPTDWVIVHDNWAGTARNVIIPLNFAGAWVANTTAVPMSSQAKFVDGLVPDWNQPYQYTPASANGGPGPDPNAHVPAPSVDQWNAWCAPCSGANLAGHWTDFHGWPVADTTPFPGSTVTWSTNATWQDYLADGSTRPAPTNAPGRPTNRTDGGWYMDTNRGVPYDGGGGVMGGYFYGNVPHTGTYLKDIHAGLHYFFPPPSRRLGQECWVTNWVTGTQGRSFSGGWNATNGPAQTHLNGASAFGEVMSEINTNRTLLISFKHWNILQTQFILGPAGTNTESANGGTYYIWGGQPSPATNAEDEVWNFYDGPSGLGHTVTAVGYIPAGDPLDVGPQIGLGPTDWVIVHDNWASTPRNVVIPLDFANNWVANTTAHPEVAHFAAEKIELVAVTNVVISFTTIPGALHDLEWNSDLVASNWQIAVSNMTYSPGTMQVTNTVTTSTTNRFYRIKAND